MKATIAITGFLMLIAGFIVAADARTAVKIAVAVWAPIYGEKEIAKEKPYHATLTNGVWTVEGTFHGSGFGAMWFYRPLNASFPTFQCIWPDLQGRFPHEVGFDPRFVGRQIDLSLPRT